MKDNYNKPTLGVVTISYNEEEDIVGFLDNLLPWVDEIVIVDDGSTDRTKETAQSAGKKVKFVESARQCGEYFAQQRNKGIAAAQSDWLLHMDIDERVGIDLAQEIQNAITDGNKDAFCYSRLNYFLHRPMRGGGWQDWNRPHLARRKALRFEGMFHEDCILNVSKDRVGYLKNKMHHLNDAFYTERLKKSDRYLPEVVERIRRKDRRIGYFDIGFYSLRECIYKYLYKKGFLDGVPGLIFALHSACAVFRAYALVWDEQNRIERKTLEQKIKDFK